MNWWRRWFPTCGPKPAQTWPVLPAFGSTRTCPKCANGWTRFTRTYRFGYTRTQVIGAAHYEYYVGPEHFRVTCTCGYAWSEACADAAPPVPPAPAPPPPWTDPGISLGP